jgi:hypothetical protein
VLNAVYEEDFLGFSYGFRPGRGQHDALDALSVAISETRVNWILDADIRSFFDGLSQKWLVRFLEHRISDERVIRLVRKWLKAADGKRREADIVVFASGFKLGEMAARLGITGVGGRTLAQAWASNDPSAYLGLAPPGFPNFFCMIGPGASLGHGGGITFQAKCQVRYIASCIAQMAARDVDVRREVLDDFMQRFDAEHETLIWSHPCRPTTATRAGACTRCCPGASSTTG